MPIEVCDSTQSESVPHSSGRRLRVAVMALVTASFIWWMSLYHVLKFGNWGIAAAYLAGAVAACYVIFSLMARADIPPRVGQTVSIAVVGAAIALLVLVYPTANVQVKGKGSDRDDALNQGARAMLRGEWPYYSTTYHGLPISPMPGALLLALPFVVVGGSVWQIPFWLGLFAWTVGSLTRSQLRAAAAMLLIVPVWLTMLQEIATGGDYNLNGIYVLCPSLWLLMLSRNRVVLLLVTAAIAGIALASRLNYLVTLPCLLAAMQIRLGTRLTLLLAGVAGGVFVAISLPFYLYDPPLFGPFLMQDKFGEIGPWASGRGWIFGIAALLANLVVASLVRRCKLEPVRGYLIGFVVATLLPGIVGSFLQLVISHDLPLFVRWTSGAIPCLVLLMVMPSRPHGVPDADGTGQPVAKPSPTGEGQGCPA